MFNLENLEDLEDLKSLFIPERGRVDRVPNRLAKGFLKRSILNYLKNNRGKYTPHQGKRECERRRQHLKGIDKSVNL